MSGATMEAAQRLYAACKQSAEPRVIRLSSAESHAQCSAASALCSSSELQSSCADAGYMGDVDLLGSFPYVESSQFINEALVATDTASLPASVYKACSSSRCTESKDITGKTRTLCSPTAICSSLARQVANRSLLAREHSELKITIPAHSSCEKAFTRSKTAVLPGSDTDTTATTHPCTPGCGAATYATKAPSPPCSTDASSSFSTPCNTPLPMLQLASLSFGGAPAPVRASSPCPSPLSHGAERPSSRRPQVEAQPMLPRFVPLEVPAEGLIFLSPMAHQNMARNSSWSLHDYNVTRKLYAGYASTVCKATCLRSGQDVVVKAYALSGLSDFLRHQVLRELRIHSRLCNPGVVQMLAAFREGDTLVMVLEYVRGGSLDRARRKLGGRMTEQQALELVMAPLLRTLHYLHTQTIVHRDIKPENLLFTPDWKLKVCDYGVSICLGEERAVTRTGSRDYMAPEVNVCPLKRTPADNKENPQMAYGAAVDVWSVGALAYELLVGFTPFPGGPATIRGTQPAKALPFPSGVSAEAREFVRACLELHPGDRPTVQQLLRHPWVASGLQRQAAPVAAAAGAPAVAGQSP